MIWSLMPSNVAGRTKKSVTSSVIFTAYCVGNSIGAQLFRAEWAVSVASCREDRRSLITTSPLTVALLQYVQPDYIPAIGLCAAFYGLEFILSAFTSVLPWLRGRVTDHPSVLSSASSSSGRLEDILCSHEPQAQECHRC